MAAQSAPEVKEEVRALAQFVSAPDTTKESVASFITSLDTPRLPIIVTRAREVSGLIKAVIDQGETEMRLRAAVTDGTQADAVQPGARWTDPGTGVVHRFEGELSDWKVADPAGLRHALARLTRPVDGSRVVEDFDVDRAVVPTYKPNHVILNELAKRGKQVADVIDSFRKKDRGPAHLKEEKA